MSKHHRISYVEWPAQDLPATKAFFTEVFGWAFVDYGPEYASFAGVGIDGGFFQSALRSSAEKGAALVVIYSEDLEATLDGIVAAGGEITHPIFPFPGGRRFHFTEPSGNEFAVWSDPQPESDG